MNQPSCQEISDALFAARQVDSIDTVTTMIRGLSAETRQEVGRLVTIKRDEAETTNDEETCYTANFLLGLLNPTE
jgi:hypothetical protein